MNETPRFPDADAARAGIALSLVEGVGSVGFRARVERHGSAAAAFNATVRHDQQARALRVADGLLARAQDIGASVRVFGEPDYPAMLQQLGDPPPVLYALGQLALLQRIAVALVGMRHSSPGGERIARLMARACVTHGGVVISGMARGIDAAAHEGALDGASDGGAGAGGTIAVLGGGVDVPYPPRHRALHHRLASEGLVLSEAPPGAAPAPGAFPRRNRIIAALAQAVVVVEAGIPSGALITADIALELGRHVGALPGAIDSPRAAGTNRLIRDGATIVTCADDMLDLAGLPRSSRRSETSTGVTPRPAARDVVAPDEPATRAVLDAIRGGASELHQVAALTRLTAREVSTSVVSLELLGLVTSAHDGSVRLTP